MLSFETRDRITASLAYIAGAEGNLRTCPPEELPERVPCSLGKLVREYIQPIIGEVRGAETTSPLQRAFLSNEARNPITDKSLYADVPALFRRPEFRDAGHSDTALLIPLDDRLVVIQSSVSSDGSSSMYASAQYTPATDAEKQDYIHKRRSIGDEVAPETLLLARSETGALIYGEAWYYKYSDAELVSYGTPSFGGGQPTQEQMGALYTGFLTEGRVVLAALGSLTTQQEG